MFLVLWTALLAGNVWFGLRGHAFNAIVAAVMVATMLTPHYWKRK